MLKLKNFKKDDYTSFQEQEKYEHVGPKVTSTQDGKRSQVDDSRLCLANDPKEAQIHMQIKGTSSSLKSKDHYAYHKLKDKASYTCLLVRSIPVCLGELYLFAWEKYTYLLGRSKPACLGEVYLFSGEKYTICLDNGTTRKKKYEELSVTEKLQADCHLKATNIVLQGLPPDVYAIASHHIVSKEIW
ncbi:hypothetical protein Tco_1260533, partial [Tanacetum coccineum]